MTDVEEYLPLQGVPMPGRWAQWAACKTTDPETFFPGRGEATKPAKDFCARCIVAGACLDYALRHQIKFGVWGGTSPGQRKRIRRSAA